jgi:hypothetical protein
MCGCSAGTRLGTTMELASHTDPNAVGSLRKSKQYALIRRKLAKFGLSPLAHQLHSLYPRLNWQVLFPTMSGSAAKQPDAPFLVATESSSEKMIASGDAASLALLPFHDAAERWLESRKPSLKGRTPVSCEHRISQLNKFFGDLRVKRDSCRPSERISKGSSGEFDNIPRRRSGFSLEDDLRAVDHQPRTQCCATGG